MHRYYKSIADICFLVMSGSDLLPIKNFHNLIHVMIYYYMSCTNLKGNPTDISNCEMLCSTHNRAKGNK